MEDTDNSALWDRKYEEGLPSLTKPDPFFVSAYENYVHQSFRNAGRALDLAAGLGRHTLWLAERAWQVSAVDVSEVAIAKLRQAAGQLNVKINLFAIDAAEYDFEPERFDLIVLFYHLERNLFPKIVSALKPGGLFICKMAVSATSKSLTTLQLRLRRYNESTAKQSSVQSDFPYQPIIMASPLGNRWPHAGTTLNGKPVKLHPMDWK